jgi:general secretion pathway protein D
MTSDILGRGRFILTPLAAAICSLFLSACSSLPSSEKEKVELPTTFVNMSAAREAEKDVPDAVEPPIRGRTLLEQKGNQGLVKPMSAAVPSVSPDKMVNVHFDNAPLVDVLGALLGDMLKVPYTIAGDIGGQVTLVSTDPVPQDSLLDLLEHALGVQGIAMVKDPSGVYRIGPADKLKGSVPVATKSAATARGYTVRIIPLRYLPASEVEKVFEPLGMKDNILRVDPVRNIVMLGGSSPQMQNMLRTLDMLDVDVLKGMSFGIYEVLNLDPELLVERFNALLTNPAVESLSSSARLVALEELNSVMVVAASAEQLSSVSHWLRELDNAARNDEQAGSQLYVYNVENGEAANLASLLNQLYGGAASDGSTASTSGTTAPGLQRSELAADGSTSSSSGSSSTSGLGSTFGSRSKSTTGASPASATTTESGARIVADEANNSLLVMASNKDWRDIQSALRKMDKTPAQVLVEVSIWEVSLTDELSYGVEWYFNASRDAQGALTKGGLLSMNDAGTVAASPPGFSYLFSGSDWRAVINALQKKSNVKSLSSPSLLVLDNREASIQVGDQQPVQTSQTVNTSNTGVLTQSIEYKDTGVQLKVRPRVNSGGLVVMDILQEVTDVGERDAATGQRSFLKRSLESSVAIQGGDTIILGGLIQNKKEESKGGLPYLQSLPVIGPLFSTTTDGDSRTELLVTITPRAINRYRDFERVGEEFRKKMPGMAESFREEMLRRAQ